MEAERIAPSFSWETSWTVVSFAATVASVKVSPSCIERLLSQMTNSGHLLASRSACQ